jgi:hypothetical protein
VDAGVSSLVATLSGPLAGMLRPYRRDALNGNRPHDRRGGSADAQRFAERWFAMLALLAIEAALVLRSVSLKALLAGLLVPVNCAPCIFHELPDDQSGIHDRPADWRRLIYLLDCCAILAGCNLYLAAGWMVRDSAMQRSQEVSSLPLAESSAAQPVCVKLLQALRSDRILLLFTLASILTSFVFGRFISGYLAQYLIAVYGAQQYARTSMTALPQMP